MDTIGSLIDKLITIDMKLWDAQEYVYKIRKMPYKEFLATYNNLIGMRILYEGFQKATDLNLQRNDLIDEIDETLIKAIQSDDKRRKFIQKKHKTY